MGRNLCMLLAPQPALPGRKRGCGHPEGIADLRFTMKALRISVGGCGCDFDEWSCRAGAGGCDSAAEFGGGAADGSGGGECSSADTVVAGRRAWCAGRRG